MEELKFKQLKNEGEKGHIIIIEDVVSSEGERCVKANGNLFCLKDKRMKEWFDLFDKGFLPKTIFPSYAEVGILPDGNYFIELLDDDKEYVFLKEQPSEGLLMYGLIAQSIIRKDMEDE
jgi:hypothetical protein